MGQEASSYSEQLERWSRKLASTAKAAAANRTNETELREDLDPVVRSAISELFGVTSQQVTAEQRSHATGSHRPYDKV